MWIVLLDNSASMASSFENEYEPHGRVETVHSPNKLDAAKRALLKHLNTIAHQERVVLCTFNGEPTCLGQDFRASDLSPIETCLSRVVPFDGTDLARALQFCRQYITSSGAKTLIVSDGLTDAADAIGQAVSLAENGVTIFFILIDPAPATEGLAREITARSGGFFWSVRSDEQLDKGLSDVPAAWDAASAEANRALAAARATSSPPADEAVAFTAGYPAQVPIRERSLLICVVHLKRLASSVQLLLQSQFTPEGEEPTVALASADADRGIPIGSQVDVVPSVDGVTFFPRSFSIHWGGTLDPVPFLMRPTDETPGRRCGAVDFSVDGAALARLKIEVEVCDKASSSSWQSTSNNELECVFISYSRKDSRIVDKYEKLWQGAGIDYFRDTKSLRSGDHWRQKLAAAIDECTIFQLFWSRNSCKSRWVAREYNIAVEAAGRKKGDRFIRPVAWESDAPRLPRKLNHLQLATISVDDL